MLGIKKLWAKVALVLAGLMMIGGVAQAATYGSPYRVNLGFNHCAVFMYVDYNWWEELWGKRDGAEYQYRVLC
jgi:hypothetical protein